MDREQILLLDRSTLVSLFQESSRKDITLTCLIDQTERTINQIVSSQMDIKADWLLKGRIRQVNIWRPLYNPVYDCGLCVADAQTVRDDDIIECHRIRESDGGFLDTMGTIKYRDGREWWYMSEMEPEDCVLFMGYDSDCSRGKKEGTGCTSFFLRYLRLQCPC
jgi:hypothetical protein